MRILITSLLLVGCGEGGAFLKRKPYEHKELKPYAQMFYKDAASYGRKVDNKISYYMKKEPISEPNDNFVGVCYRSETPVYASYIIISEDYWKKASFVERKALMYHELAHCAMDLDHVPVHPSILYPSVYSEKYLTVWLDRMIETLFKNDGVPK